MDKPAQPKSGLQWHWHVHWQAILAAITVGFALAAVSTDLRAGPEWAPPVVVICLLIPIMLTRGLGMHVWSRRLGFLLLILASGSLAWSVGTLVHHLYTDTKMSGNDLLKDAALLWVCNVVIFALWYWQLDGGGPMVRHVHGYQPTDLLFPQSQQGGELAEGWCPLFIDYVFVAFNTSSAFSPTDTLALTPRVKVLMMLQSLSSIVILAVIAGRAINTLKTDTP
jgi:hypothetical protein